MAIGKCGTVHRHLQTLFSVGTLRDLTDGQLLERFATGQRDAADPAFTAMVERHGPMVLPSAEACWPTPRTPRTRSRRPSSCCSRGPADSGCRTPWAPGSIRWRIAPHPSPGRRRPVGGATSAVRPGRSRPVRSRANPALTTRRGGCSTRRSAGSPTVTACRSCSVTFRVTRARRRRGRWDVQSGRSRAGGHGAASGCGRGSLVAAWPHRMSCWGYRLPRRWYPASSWVRLSEPWCSSRRTAAQPEWFRRRPPPCHGALFEPCFSSAYGSSRPPRRSSSPSPWG